jgi:dipeptidyl aminopeptidase/acylaminoacyl peptidase
MGFMNFTLRGMGLRLLVGCLGLCSSAHAQGAAGGDHGLAKRSITVADAIEMTRIGDRFYFTKPDNVVQFSPDRSKFAFVIQKGNLKNDTVEFSLLVFQTAEAFNSPRSEVVATLASSSNREGIHQVQWLPDNDTIVFLGEQPGEMPQIYKVSTRTKTLERLTHQPTPILAYSMSELGDSFVYVAEIRPRPVVSDEMRRRGFFVTSQQWDDLYVNQRRFETRHEIFVKTAQMKTPQPVGGGVDLNPLGAGELRVSPNGRYALLWAYRTSPPPFGMNMNIKLTTKQRPWPPAMQARLLYARDS